MTQKYQHLPKMAFVLKLRAWAQVSAFVFPCSSAVGLMQGANTHTLQA